MKAGCQKPLRREQEHGPQHEVNPAASSDAQRESRVAHVTAKATSAVRSSGYGTVGLSGVEGAARAQGSVGNRRDPSAQPWSGQARPHKPSAKPGRVQRESEGVVVPLMGVQQNAPGGTDPHFGRARATGTGEGMVRTTGSKHPGEREPIDNVRRLQRKLFVAAKRHPGRRFHALFDHICRSDVLQEAWTRVRRNQGAAGVDGQTLAAAEEYGVTRLLGELADDLRQRRYRPSPVLRRHILKPAGGTRPLGIPTVKDRIAQMAAKLVLEPIFEADFRPSSFGYRPRRRALDALETIREAANSGAEHILDADITDFFGSLDHELLMGFLRQRISDRRVLTLIRRWLGAGVLERDSPAQRSRASLRAGSSLRC